MCDDDGWVCMCVDDEAGVRVRGRVLDSRCDRVRPRQRSEEEDENSSSDCGSYVYFG